jgi:hypothetical protein
MAIRIDCNGILTRRKVDDVIVYQCSIEYMYEYSGLGEGDGVIANSDIGTTEKTIS